MVSTQGIEATIALGEHILINKRILALSGALWLYDYFITLADEVECVWSGRRSWALAWFILNRYWPLSYLLWVFVAFWSPEFTKQMCDKSAWLSVFYFVIATLFAEVMIALRIFAITRRNAWIAACFSLIISAQFIFGMYLTVSFGSRPALTTEDIPLGGFQVCYFQTWRTGEAVYLIFSLVYDITGFLVIVHSSRGFQRLPRTSGLPRLPNDIVRGATIYFFVIFTSNISLVFFVLVAPEAFPLLPSPIYAVLMPMITARLAISLRKTANTPNTVSGVSGAAEVSRIRFDRDPFGVPEHGRGDISLDCISATRHGLVASGGLVM